VAERLTDSSKTQVPYAISPDGKRLVFREDAPDATTHDLMVLSLESDRRVQPLIHSRFDEHNADLSPDGLWIAYESNESGQYEVFVRPFPDVSSGRWQVSTGGGTRPLWSRNGRELFYMATSGTTDAAIMSVSLGQGGFKPGAVTKLFEGRYSFSNLAGTTGAGRTYDASADGQRFLMIKDSAGSENVSASPRIIVVLNWTEELKRLVPAN
jgi:serine/threonine-protein kinase